MTVHSKNTVSFLPAMDQEIYHGELPTRGQNMKDLRSVRITRLNIFFSFILMFQVKKKQGVLNFDGLR